MAKALDFPEKECKIHSFGEDLKMNVIYDLIILNFFIKKMPF